MLTSGWRQRLQGLQRDTYALYFACRDPRVPWYAKAFGVAVVAYAVSPIDLIPDFIPVLGYLDDMLIIPAGLFLVAKMIPAPILAEHRSRAGEVMTGPSGRMAAVTVVATWLVLLTVAVLIFVR